MIKSGNDPKVKKTLLRNCERKINKLTVHKETKKNETGPSKTSEQSSKNVQKENELIQPTLCSSEALANYLFDIKDRAPPPPKEDLNFDKSELSTKITRKLNFHFNDRIYKNLIELNTNLQELKTRKDKKLLSAVNSAKRDLEPNMEDFYDDEIESDLIPNIPDIKPKFKSVKKINSGQLHRLLTSFEDI